MPKGVPKDRPEEVAMKFTSFFIPSPINSKNVASGYLKHERQTIWDRNVQQGGSGGKRKRTPIEVEASQDVAPSTESEKRGSDVLIVQPGSRYLRISRASDSNPICIPNVIARKRESLANLPPEPTQRHIHQFNPSATPTKKNVAPPEGSEPLPKDFRVDVDPEDETDVKVGDLRWHLRSRMHSLGLKAIRDGSQQAAKYNKSARNSTVMDDPETVSASRLGPEDRFIVGDQVFNISDSDVSNYTIRWPFRGSKFNIQSYCSRAELLGDIQAIWASVLQNTLSISTREFRDYSVILVVPDYWDRVYVRDLGNLLLVQMGFRRLCVQQESVCSSFGAGLASACVVDIGAAKTSVACVEEGLVLSETRLNLDFGGDDVSEFLFLLLQRINLPLHIESGRLWTKSYYWSMIEDFKVRSATLAEVDVDIIPYQIFLRPPGEPTQRYSIKVYDEPNVASMLLFHPDIIDFKGKHSSDNTLWIAEHVEDMDVLGDPITQAMISATVHLVPDPEAPVASDLAPSETNEVVMGDSVTLTAPKTDEGATSPSLSKNKLPTPATVAAEDGMSVAVDNGAKAPPIDIRLMASQQPLDLAVFHSIRVSSANPGVGGAERWKKMLSSVLVVGGTALTPGMLHALGSRLKAVVASDMPGLEDTVAVIPAPKEIDPRILAWRGACLLAKLDSLNDSWVQSGDWEILGMRALKERSLFL